MNPFENPNADQYQQTRFLDNIGIERAKQDAAKQELLGEIYRHDAAKTSLEYRSEAADRAAKYRAKAQAQGGAAGGGGTLGKVAGAVGTVGSVVSGVAGIAAVF
jgi:hypothetical protein